MLTSSLRYNLLIRGQHEPWGVGHTRVLEGDVRSKGRNGRDSLTVVERSLGPGVQARTCEVTEQGSARPSESPIDVASPLLLLLRHGGAMLVAQRLERDIVALLLLDHVPATVAAA